MAHGTTTRQPDMCGTRAWPSIGSPSPPEPGSVLETTAGSGWAPKCGPGQHISMAAGALIHGRGGIGGLRASGTLRASRGPRGRRAGRMRLALSRVASPGGDGLRRVLRWDAGCNQWWHRRHFQPTCRRRHRGSRRWPCPGTSGGIGLRRKPTRVPPIPATTGRLRSSIHAGRRVPGCQTRLASRSPAIAPMSPRGTLSDHRLNASRNLAPPDRGRTAVAGTINGAAGASTGVVVAAGAKSSLAFSEQLAARRRKHWADR